MATMCLKTEGNVKEVYLSERICPEGYVEELPNSPESRNLVASLNEISRWYPQGRALTFRNVGQWIGRAIHFYGTGCDERPVRYDQIFSESDPSSPQEPTLTFYPGRGEKGQMVIEGIESYSRIVIDGDSDRGDGKDNSGLGIKINMSILWLTGVPGETLCREEMATNSAERPTYKGPYE